MNKHTHIDLLRSLLFLYTQKRPLAWHTVGHSDLMSSQEETRYHFIFPAVFSPQWGTGGRAKERTPLASAPHPPVTPLLFYPNLSDSICQKEKKAGCFTMSSVIAILIYCADTPAKSNLRKEVCTLVCSLRKRSITEGAAAGVRGHITPAVRKRRKTSINAQHAFSSLPSLALQPMKWSCSQSAGSSHPQ